MNPPVLTSQQEQACGLAVTLLRDKSSDCRIGGYAGTGKTTLIASVVERLSANYKRVLVMAPTGKAANVLCNKGVNATTIHRQLYELTSERPVEFKLKPYVEADYFIIDESSMISVELFDDIKSFKKPTLFIGDPAQLEPVGDDAKLMHTPDFTLTQIHRTAEDSAIIQFATGLRSSAMHPHAFVSSAWYTHHENPNLVFRAKDSIRRSEWLAFDQIIVGKNTTRILVNQTLKKSLEPLPTLGDKLICLKNDYLHGVFNGEIFTVCSDEFGTDDESGEITIKLESFDGEQAWYPFWRDFFFDNATPYYHRPKACVWLDYAYGITCHKSQGSEWNNVAVIDEAFGTPPNRWRYTAATRAAKHLTWIK